MKRGETATVHSPRGEPLPGPAGSASVSDGRLSTCLMVSCCLVWCRLLMPAESAARGDTALVVFAWCLFTSFVCWWQWRNAERIPLRIDGIDLCLAVICLMPMLSTLALWLTGGQLRNAVNMSWEWLGCLLAIVWCRQLWRRLSGDLPPRLLLALGIALSVQGIYQHHVQLPAARASILPLVQDWRELQQSLEQETGSAFLRQRQLEKKAELERRLYANGIPTDARGQDVFLQRLGSTEPFAFFALTNTLAGVLTVCLIFLCDAGTRLFTGSTLAEGHSWRRGLCLLLPLALVGYCLLLTKSRTAWLGCVVGGSYLLIAMLLQHPRQRRLVLKLGACVILVGLGLLVVTWGLGGVDTEVLTEAGKSLRYRGEYWSASSTMLADQWWLGVGPGNFRQNYLAYKLPESSEEILDPHNLLLDAWANGGVLGLLGTLALLFGVCHQALRQFRAAETSASPAEKDFPVKTRWPWLGLGTVAVLASLLASPRVSPLLEEILVTTLVAGIGLACLSVLPTASERCKRAWSAAALALLIHLLGAGGFSMPIILQLLLLLGLTWYLPGNWGGELRQRALPIVAGVCLCLAATGWWGVIAPDLASIQTEAELTSSRSAKESFAILKRWTEADRLSPDPWMQLSQFQQAEAERNRDATLLREAIASQQQAIVRDPRNYSGYRLLAGLERRLADWTGDAEAGSRAIQAQKMAIARYPHLANLHLELARYLESAGRQNEIPSIASEALRLDAINQKAGHPDRLLPEADLIWLKKW